MCKTCNYPNTSGISGIKNIKQRNKISSFNATYLETIWSINTQRRLEYTKSLGIVPCRDETQMKNTLSLKGHTQVAAKVQSFTELEKKCLDIHLSWKRAREVKCTHDQLTLVGCVEQGQMNCNVS